jgi:DNA-directed RNA polymerase subunit RPC12/RpoP
VDPSLERLWKPVVVAAFRSPSEAAVAGTALETAGIVTEVRPRSEELERRCADAFNEGFDVVVSAADADAAVEVLRDVWPDEVAIDIEVLPRCPECGSEDLVRVRRLRVFVIALVVLLPAGVLTGQRDLFLLLIGIIGALLVIAPNQRCLACGERSRGRGAPPGNAPPVEPRDIACPRCGSMETGTIGRRREKALTLLVNFVVPPTLLVWPFLRRYRCSACGHEWR